MLVSILKQLAKLVSALSNRSELESCLGRVFNFKLDSFASYQQMCIVFMQPFLELKTGPRVTLLKRLILTIILLDSYLCLEARPFHSNNFVVTIKRSSL